MTLVALKLEEGKTRIYKVDLPFEQARQAVQAEHPRAKGVLALVENHCESIENEPEVA